MRILFLAFTFLLFCVGQSGAAAAAEPNDPPPAGSYLKTCRVLSYSALTGRLAAMCKEVDDRNVIEKISDSLGASADFPMAAVIDARYCKDASIWNGDGKLYCITTRPWGAAGAVPSGSYLQSCTEPQINGGVLSARCKDGDGNARTSDLLVEQCRFDRDVWNRYGNLKCEPGTTPAQPLPAVMTLTPIQPGVGTVSPGAIKALTGPNIPAGAAPPAPEPAAASEPEDGGQKKKRRRDRGERG